MTFAFSLLFAAEWWISSNFDLDGSLKAREWNRGRSLYSTFLAFILMLQCFSSPVSFVSPAWQVWKGGHIMTTVLCWFSQWPCRTEHRCCWFRRPPTLPPTKHDNDDSHAFTLANKPRLGSSQAVVSALLVTFAAFIFIFGIDKAGKYRPRGCSAWNMTKTSGPHSIPWQSGHIGLLWSP